MGQVFTWQQYRDHEIPELSSFTEVVDNMRSKLGATNGVVGAIVCGSCMWGTHDQRSDVGCVVLYHFDSRECVFRVLREIKAQAQALHVPAQLIPVDAELATLGMHDISYLFSRHLDGAVNNGGLIKQNPIPFLVFQDNSPPPEVRDYVRHKMGKLQKGFAGLASMNEGGRCDYLQEILEIPINLTRKMLALKGCKLEGDTKAKVAEKFRQVASGYELDLFLKITELDTQYSQVICDRSSTYPNEQEYACLLNEIESVAWSAIEFVRLNALSIL